MDWRCFQQLMCLAWSCTRWGPPIVDELGEALFKEVEQEVVVSGKSVLVAVSCLPKDTKGQLKSRHH